VTGRSAVQVCLWNSPYLGNFMESELLLAGVLLERLGLGTHFVLGDGAQAQSWLTELDREGMSWSIAPTERSRWRAHLRDVAQEYSAALLHTHFTATDLVGAAVAAELGIPCVWQIRTGFNGYPFKQRAKDLLKMRFIARRRVARIIAVSPWLGEFTRRRGAPGDRIEVLPDPVILQRFEHLPERAAARERFGLSTDAKVILALGWWPDVKGVDILLDALEELAVDHPEMQTLLVGEQRMRSFLADRLPRQPSWLKTSGFIDDAAWLYAAADVFVSASRHEGQSYAVGEAITCGLPVVMSDIAGTAGWGTAPSVSTFPSENAVALGARLADMLAEEGSSLAETGAENRRFAWENLGPETWCGRLSAIYEELLKAG
jgi:glycosyltransferase involved in cell wall biosynthesis